MLTKILLMYGYVGMFIGLLIFYQKMVLTNWNQKGKMKILIINILRIIFNSFKIYIFKKYIFIIKMTNEILLDEIKFGDHRGDEFPQPINPDAEYNEVKKQFTDRGWEINGLDRDELIELSQNENCGREFGKEFHCGDDKFCDLRYNKCRSTIAKSRNYNRIKKSKN